MEQNRTEVECKDEQAPLGVRGLAYHFDTTVPIENIPDLASDPALLEKCRTAGFSRFSKSTGVVKQAATSATKTLASCGMKPEEVDAIVIGINCLHRINRSFETISEQILCRLPIRQAQIFGVMTGGCANFASVIRAARNLIIAEGYRNVLVIETNRSAADGERLVFSGDRLGQVMGDGAVSFMVTRDSPDFLICGMAQLTTPLSLAPPEQSTLMASHVTGSRNVIGHALDQAGIDRDQLLKAFLPNVRIPALYGLTQTNRLPQRLLYLDNIPRIGHLWSADPLINMLDFTSKEAPPSGSFFLSYSHGMRYFAAIVFRKT